MTQTVTTVGYIPIIPTHIPNKLMDVYPISVTQKTQRSSCEKSRFWSSISSDMAAGQPQGLGRPNSAEVTLSASTVLMYIPIILMSHQFPIYPEL